MDACRIDGIHGLHTRQYAGDHIARQLMNELPKRGVLLRRPTDDYEGPNRAAAMIDPLDSQHRKIVRQAVIAQMIAEWAFRLERCLRIDMTNDAKIGVGINR